MGIGTPRNSGASRRMERAGLPRRCAPRNDEFFRWTPLPRLRGRVPEGRERASYQTERSDADFFAVGRGQASFLPPPFYPASLRSAWYETLSRPSGTLPRKRGREVHRKNSSLRGAQRRGNPVRSTRRAAPLDKKGRRNETPVHSPPPSNNQRRCAPHGRKPSPGLRPPSRPPSGGGTSIGRTRHCEERSDVAIQFVPPGAQRRGIKRDGGTKRPTTLHRQEIISGAARRMVGSPLPAFGHPPSQAGEGLLSAVVDKKLAHQASGGSACARGEV
jgi:hypothetical protein